MRIIVNEKGLRAIAVFLFANHKNQGAFTLSQIAAWASEAERHAYNNNVVFIELNSRDSRDGRSKFFYLDEGQYDYVGENYDHSS